MSAFVGQHIGTHRTLGTDDSMQVYRLLSDVTKLPAGASRRQQQIKLTELLQQRYGEDAITYKGVAKWFERGSIPSTWLLRVCALPKKPLNPTDYAGQ
jgi:hypothetical protein